MARLPTVGSDNNSWGTVLNSFLAVAHVQSGTFAGSITLVSAQTSAYTIGSNSTVTTGGETVLVNATGGAVTITLPDATASTVYNMHNIKKIDVSVNNVTLATTLSQTIDGGTTATIKVQYASISVVSDGSNWNIV
jgi:hypothetical protein